MTHFHINLIVNVPKKCNEDIKRACSLPELIDSLLFIEYRKYVKDSKYIFLFKKLQFSDDWSSNQLSLSVLTKENGPTVGHGDTNFFRK